MGLEPYTDVEDGVSYDFFNEVKDINMEEEFCNPHDPDDELPF